MSFVQSSGNIARVFLRIEEGMTAAMSEITTAEITREIPATVDILLMRVEIIFASPYASEHREMADALRPILSFVRQSSSLNRVRIVRIGEMDHEIFGQKLSAVRDNRSIRRVELVNFVRSSTMWEEISRSIHVRQFILEFEPTNADAGGEGGVESGWRWYPPTLLHPWWYLPSLLHRWCYLPTLLDSWSYLALFLLLQSSCAKK